MLGYNNCVFQAKLVNFGLPLVFQDRLELVTALGPQLEQLSAEVGSLGAMPSLKDSIVVVSAHHASTLQRLQSSEKEINKGIFAKR